MLLLVLNFPLDFGSEAMVQFGGRLEEVEVHVPLIYLYSNGKPGVSMSTKQVLNRRYQKK